MNGRVLCISGSDSGGGAGVQADVKTVTALGGYAATAITALTAQNTQGVFAVWGVPVALITQQIEVVLDDIGADCIKTGMLHNAEVIEAVAQSLAERGQGIPIVIDPVMYAKGGDLLLEPDAVSRLRERLLPLASVLTPNLPEAEALTGRRIDSVDDQIMVARQLRDMGPEAVFLKGGRSKHTAIVDVLVSPAGESIMECERLDTRSIHGTGCTLATAVATGLAQGLLLRQAVDRARLYLLGAIQQAPDIGGGFGPLNHAHCVPPFEVGLTELRAPR